MGCVAETGGFKGSRMVRFRKSEQGGLAVVKGAGERQNAGDQMMHAQLNELIKRCGLRVVAYVGHKYPIEDLNGKDPGEKPVIFELSAIQYTDAWNDKTSLYKRLARSVEFYGKFPAAKRVFMPSSWGPFDESDVGALESLTRNSILLVRDSQSMVRINKSVGEIRAVFCPDLAFGHPVSGVLVGRARLAKKQINLAFAHKRLFGIIPNERCADQKIVGVRAARDYVALLNMVVDWARDRGYFPVCISHMLNSERDTKLLSASSIPIFNPVSLQSLRSLVANLSLAVCSRYHGVISCLSHGVPTVVVGWQDKYSGLMEDLHLGDYVQDCRDAPGRVLNSLDLADRYCSQVSLRINESVRLAKANLEFHLESIVERILDEG